MTLEIPLGTWILFVAFYGMATWMLGYLAGRSDNGKADSDE